MVADLDEILKHRKAKNCVTWSFKKNDKGEIFHWISVLVLWRTAAETREKRIKKPKTPWPIADPVLLHSSESSWLVSARSRQHESQNSQVTGVRNTTRRHHALGAKSETFLNCFWSRNRQCLFRGLDVRGGKLIEMVEVTYFVAALAWEKVFSEILECGPKESPQWKR